MIEEAIVRVNRRKKREAEKRKRKVKRRRNVFYDILTAFCVIVICVCSILIYEDISYRTESQAEISEIQEYRPQMVYPDDSEVDFNMQASVSYSALKNINSDYVGWIMIPGTDIDMPVCQASNNDYYLQVSFRDEYSPYGCPFLDCDNDSRFLDMNSVVYGHTTYDGNMFSSLKNYRDQSYYLEHPFIYMFLEDRTYCYQVFASVVLDGSEDYRSPYYPSMEDFADNLKYRSYLYSSASVTDDDRVLTLSTCVATNSPERLAIFAVLINPGGESVDTSQITL